LRIIPFLKNSKVVFAEVSAKRIKIFVFSKKRQRLLKYIELPFGDKISAAGELERLSKKLKLRYTSLYVGVSQSIAINKYVDLPTGDEKEIPDLLKWQLPNLVFYPAEDILYSYKVMNKSATKSQLMLFLVSKRLLMPYLQAFSKAGFNIEKIVLNPEITAQWAMRKRDEYHFKFPLCLINVDGFTGEVTVLNKDGLLFSRGFNVSDNEPVDQIAREIEISLDVYKKIPIAKPISQIYVYGENDISSDVFKTIQEVLLPGPSVLNVAGVSGFEGYKDSRVSLSTAKQFSTLDSIEFSMQFTPYEFLRKQENRNAIRDLAYTFSMLFLLGVLMIYHLLAQYRERISIYSQLEDRYTYIKRLSDKLKQDKLIVSKMKSIIPKSLFLPALKEISEAKGKEISIDLILYRASESISIKGLAKELQDVLSFVENLNTSGLFVNCEIKYAVNKEVMGEEKISFEVFCRLKGAKR